mmetsp:Transcript_17194/g.23758  ORF Transcript_17194/g.23758 Transcript_17194/m.23758 type:complete len:177 (+) Transcript_17194:406-936(+)
MCPTCFSDTFLLSRFVHHNKERSYYRETTKATQIESNRDIDLFTHPLVWSNLSYMLPTIVCLQRGWVLGTPLFFLVMICSARYHQIRHVENKPSFQWELADLIFAMMGALYLIIYWWTSPATILSRTAFMLLVSGLCMFFKGKRSSQLNYRVTPGYLFFHSAWHLAGGIGAVMVLL